MSNHTKQTIDNLINHLEKTLADAKRLSEENESEPRFKLAFEVGYLRGAIQNTISDLKYIKL